VPLIHGRSVPWRHAYLIEYLGKGKLHVGGLPRFVAIHTGRYLFVKYRYDDWEELYDLRSDP
jgi:hypothetical protein